MNGKIGNHITFRGMEGETRQGTITDILSNGYEVRSGFGSVLVEPNEVLNIAEIEPERKKRFGFFKNGGTTPKQELKIAKVMNEFKKGELHSGSKKGPIVKSRKQAIAIALSEAHASNKMEHGGNISHGDKVKATKEYGGKSGVVIDVRGSFITVEHRNGDVEIYHESDLIKKMGIGGGIYNSNEKIKDIHFETDPKKQEQLKIAYGKSTGEVTRSKQIETADYSLRKFRKQIEYGDGSDLGVFVPGSWDAVTSTLGNGPHAQKRKPIKWNKTQYEKWVKEMSGNGGAEHSFDMAQNAIHEAGLIDYVRKNHPGQNPLEVIQWAIEAYDTRNNVGANKKEHGGSVDKIDIGDFVKSQYGYIYLRVPGNVGGSDAYVSVEKGKIGKRKTGLHHTTILTKISETEALRKMELGGRVDLFEDYTNIPANVQNVLDKYAEEFGEDYSMMDYQDMANMQNEINALGYTFDSGLDNVPYGLRPIGVELNELEGYEEMQKGGSVVNSNAGWKHKRKRN